MPNQAIEQVNIQEHMGVIYQSLSGFYYVWADGREFVTKAKGVFRHQNVKPIVGDRVVIEENLDDPESESRLIHILPRTNSLVRPPVANVDYVILVMALVEPDFSFTLLDQYLVNLEWQEIKVNILLTKYDLLVDKLGQEQAQAYVNQIKTIYEALGYKVWIKSKEQSFVEQFKESLQKGIYVVMGQSGAGKSTFLNQLLPDVNISTAEISSALNRGRHTTRKVTLYPVEQAFLADTPGFSAMDLPLMGAADLRLTFPEIRSFGQECRFRSCVHDQEPGCRVKEAVAAEEIAASRYQSYLTLLKRIRDNQVNY
ncbi:ribosome small subunit-dependent GTPase A [Ignavigranum ruoffiae]|uniref:ribosome small subunit-dependent GTPase A n=1 Tax=Ignavigranum ruoffiae TaxID=89093 RepID=UPI002354FD90|nr:ribosome small subunit-dependent GTPase A [Ignavigranum ruoffiae]